MSEAVSRLARLAEDAGLRSREGRWSSCHHHGAGALMPAKIGPAGSADLLLEYISNGGSSHNLPDEGFIDRAAGKAISLLLRIREW
jgi:hypothetical protein